MTLTLTSQPGFSEVPSSALDAGLPLTAANLKAINSNANFAAVRNEQTWGFYKHGETVILPVSPADGYEYVREELRYEITEIYWTGAPPGTDLLGTQSLPSRGATSGPGHLLQMGFHVDQATGLVTCDVHYHQEGGAQTNTQDGILVITTLAQRQR